VLQTGADSLSQDKIGHFNLSIRGHAECVKYIRNFGLPLIILGGGGYTITNVSKCWVYETGCILGKDLDGPIPIDDEFYALYG
jgi:histone deacetylase 1/2